jgi:hypothetical protein
MDLQKHAEKLLKLAEQIEKEASDNTFFICSHCNHTASLAEINDRRVKCAAQEDPELTVKAVTINDAVACPVPGCEGKMAYVSTDTSEKFYTEEKESAEDPMLEDTVKEDKGEPAEKPAEEPAAKDKKDDDLDSEIDKLFEDVETQNAKAKQEKVDNVDTIQKARKEKKVKEQETDLLGDPNKEKSETPKDEDPLSEPSPKTEPDPSAVKGDNSEKMDTEPAEPETKKEEKPKKKKEPIDLEKKDIPKFKSKQATERYENSRARYTV